MNINFWIGIGFALALFLYLRRGSQLFRRDYASRLTPGVDYLLTLIWVVMMWGLSGPGRQIYDPNSDRDK